MFYEYLKPKIYEFVFSVQHVSFYTNIAFKINSFKLNNNLENISFHQYVYDISMIYSYFMIHSHFLKVLNILKVSAIKCLKGFDNVNDQKTGVFFPFLYVFER